MTNIFLLSWFLVSTNVESFSSFISATEQEQITQTIEYRTNIQVTVSSNILSTVRSTLRFNGTNWVPVLHPPKPVIYPPLIYPPLPPGFTDALPPMVPRAIILTTDTVINANTAKDALLRWDSAIPNPDLPKEPLPRFAIPTMPPMNVTPAVILLPTAEELRRGKLWDKHRAQ